jgi:arginyl-tRNA synthetase
VFLDLEARIQEELTNYLAARHGLNVAVTVEQPKQSSFGEFALPLAFQLAREMKRSPRQIAEELKTDLNGSIDGVASLEVAGNGYLNLRLDRGAFALALLQGAITQRPRAGKSMVEHTSINPNKAAHIGHLRNSILGDTLVRMLRTRGENVEIHNYLDNTGVQVADVVVGFHYLEKKSMADVQALIAQPKFDYLCWDLYARTSQYYKTNPESLGWRAETLHEIESGHGEVAELGHLIADAIVHLHLKTMHRLGIVYDVLPRESEILQLKFWASAFEQLKASKAIYLETEGKNKGCWVMPGSAFSEHREDEDSKVIVRSNGTVTYVGKDIAYQMWKFGALMESGQPRDFYYRLWSTYPDGKPVYVSTATPEDSDLHFGGAQRVFNVIDSRQSYLQDVVVAGLKALGLSEQAEHSTHFSYEMVALTPRTCAELGITLSEEDQKRTFVEVSGRKGLGVKADDLLDKLTEKALQEVNSRHQDRTAEQRELVATQIAIAALRYFMLKFTRNTVIAFDLQEALSFQGETGPYVQYAAVRSQRILQKLLDSGQTLPNFADQLTKERLAKQLESEDFWQLLLTTSRLDYAVENAIQGGEPSNLAKFAFQLAQAFSTFYADYRVLDEPDPERKVFLLWMTQYFRDQLARTMEVLGIPVPEFM